APGARARAFLEGFGCWPAAIARTAAFSSGIEMVMGAPSAVVAAVTTFITRKGDTSKQIFAVAKESRWAPGAPGRPPNDRPRREIPAPERSGHSGLTLAPQCGRRRQRDRRRPQDPPPLAAAAGVPGRIPEGPPKYLFSIRGPASAGFQRRGLDPAER